MKKDSYERVRRPPGENTSYGTGEVTAPGSKSLALVNNISEICSSGWGKFMVPQSLLRKVGRNLVVRRAR